MKNKKKNRAGLKIGFKYNPNTEDIDISFDINLEQETEYETDNQIESDEQLYLENE